MKEYPHYWFFSVTTYFADMFLSLSLSERSRRDLLERSSAPTGEPGSLCPIFKDFRKSFMLIS